MRYVLLDFETTGLDPSQSEIIEIGAVLMEDMEALDRFERLVRPVGDLPAAITHLTGITPQMLEKEASLGEVAPAFFEFVKDLPFVAHNSSLESSFLERHLAPLLPGGARFEVHNSIEPLALLLPDAPSHSMESMRTWAAEAGVTHESSHRALKDCEDLAIVLAHARKYARESRPEIAAIVRGLLGPGSGAEPWWWSWLFLEAGGDSPGAAPASRPDWLEAALKRPSLGDLRDLRAKDSALEEDWSKPVPPEQVREALEGRAPGAEARPGFVFRPQQEAMSQHVRQALEKGERIAIEAPTGTGKSVAYLLPGVLAAEASGAPLVVSTHSKGLQDQLLEKDIPIVRSLLGRPGIRAAAVKGQENYLCLRKLSELLGERTESTPLDERWGMAFLASFAAAAASPRVAELDRVSRYIRTMARALPEQLDWVKSHHTTTIGPGCPFYESCHFFDSARQAHGAQVILSNHALTFRWPGHLPRIRNVVFDEAHHLEEQVTQAFSRSLSETTLTEALDRLSKPRGKRAGGDQSQLARLLDGLTLPAPWADVDAAERLAEGSNRIRTRVRELRAVIPLALEGSGDSDGYEQSIVMGAPTRNPGRAATMAALEEALRNLAGAVQELSGFLSAGAAACERAGPAGGKRARSPFESDASVDLLKTHATRFAECHEALQSALPAEPAPALPGAPPPGPPNWLRVLLWSPRDSSWRLSVQPISVAEMSGPIFAPRRAVILASATLSSGSSPTFVTDRIGLPLSRPLVTLPSPFALEKQAAVYIPTDLPPPGTPAHLERLIDFTAAAATALGGRTLLLLSSNRRLRTAAEALRQRLEPKGIEVFDSSSDRRAAEAFRASGRALLVGGERYGEGLDIPGRALSLVIVEKINEAMTRGPLAEARKSRTKFALYDYDFPLRMTWLKQRAGRLIRSPEDRGAIVIFDSRAHAWSQASRQQVARALAPMPITAASPEECLRKIEEAGY